MSMHASRVHYGFGMSDMQTKWLVRYGVIPEVARFTVDGIEDVARDARVVIASPRGLEIGTVLQKVPVSSVNGTDDVPSDLQIVRIATEADEASDKELREECQIGYGEWWSRIRDWQLELELVDLEWTLDRQKLVLYVLSGRSADTTKLALFAATAGYASIEVQPVSKDGLVPMPAAEGGGCGCHDGGCSTH
jgi:cell fate regulator YaaT (PSP1 superfamily)